MEEYWTSRSRQLMVSLTIPPNKCIIKVWDRDNGYEGLCLKKKEVAWLIRTLPKMLKGMKD